MKQFINDIENDNFWAYYILFNFPPIIAFMTNLLVLPHGLKLLIISASLFTMINFNLVQLIESPNYDGSFFSGIILFALVIMINTFVPFMNAFTFVYWTLIGLSSIGVGISNYQVTQDFVDNYDTLEFE